MRKAIGALVLGLAVMAGGHAAGAQIVDPTTGIMVDAATDPMDYSAIMTGQPTDVGLEAGLSAAAQMQASMNASMAASDAATQTTMDALNAAQSNDDTPVVAAQPSTPKPVITPNGGTFKDSVQVTIADSDARAVVFYTTDGKKPTTSSARYAGPITVSAKTKVQALAFDVNMLPSGVVSQTFRVKA